jgi:hypothetical protein
MKKILFGLCAIALIATGCSKDAQNQGPLPDGDGVLEVRLVSPKAKEGSRAYTAELGETALEAVELAIKNYTIYVFDETTNTVEHAVTVNAPTDGLVTRIEGLVSTTLKTVVVIANNNAAVTLPTMTEGDPYDPINATFMGIDQQQSVLSSTQSNGLVMTGKVINQMVSANPITRVNVPIERVVAKVVLKSLTLDPSVNLDQYADFNVDGVAVQRVLSKSTVGPLDAEIQPEAVPTYVGGFVGSMTGVGSGLLGSNTSYAGMRDTDGAMITLVNGSIDAVQGALLAVSGVAGSLLDVVAAIAVPDSGPALEALVDVAVTGINSALGTLATAASIGLEGAGDLVTFALDKGLAFDMDEYFYVLPNNPVMFGLTPDQFKNSTLLTIATTYQGKRYYYPIEVNSPDYVGYGGSTANGKYIERNTVYELNVTIKDLMGNEDPDQPAKPGMIEVTVTPLDWRGPISQNVIW